MELVVALPPSALPNHRRPQVFPLWMIVVLGVLSTVAFLGCPKTPEQETLRLPLLTTDNPEAEAEMRGAREAFEAGNVEDATRRYESFIANYPNDPLVVIAHLALGQIHLAEGQLDEAGRAFDLVAAHEDPSVNERGRFYNGVLAHLRGNHREAIDVLRPFVGQLVDPVETSLLYRTLARASQAEGDRVGALAALDQLLAAPVPETDREEAEEAVDALLSEASVEDVDRAATELPRGSSVWVRVAKRALVQHYEAGNLAQVHAIAEALSEEGIALDDELAAMALRASESHQANPRAIGAILPLSGRGQAVGQLALKGLMLRARSSEPGPAAPDAPEIVFRDDAGDPERAARAVDELVTRHRVVAIVGPLSTGPSEAAARRAQELGVPLISLAPEPALTETGPLVFSMMPDPEAEARQLVRVAQAQGASRFAVVRPEAPYGETLAEAFSSAVAAEGGEVVTIETYAPDATAFGPTVTRLRPQTFDALYVADTHARVQLLAPALATGGLWPSSDHAGRGDRTIALLVPSIGFRRSILRQGGRYLEGAYFAVPFDAESPEPEVVRFVEAFRDRFDVTPDVYAATAYDAISLILGAVDEGATTRIAVANALGDQSPRTVGPSGGLGADRRPESGGRVYQVRDGDLVSVLGTAGR